MGLHCLAAMNYDCFPFFNELDLLELRLRTLEDVVDRWFIAECEVTHSGRKKPLFFKDNKSRFKRWLPRITHYVPQGHPISPDPWQNERWQRDRLLDVVSPKACDVITYTDADEIPRPDVYLRFNPTDGLNALDMRLYVYYLNTRRYQHWRYGKICSGAYWNERNSPSEMRFADLRSKWLDWGLYERLLPLGGWHFTWLGSKPQRLLKANSTAHCNDKECDDFKRQLKRTPHPQCPPVVPIDKSFPKPLIENLDYYRKIGFLKEPVEVRL